MVITLVVAAVGALVLTLTAGVLRTTSAPDRYSDSVGQEFDVLLEQFSGRPRTAEVRTLPAVERAESATFLFSGVVPLGGGDMISGFVFSGTRGAFGARVVEGRDVLDEAPGEFVATRSWVQSTRAQLGDQFQLITISQEQADESGFDVDQPAGPTLPATLVGVMDGPSELQEDTPLALFGPALLDVGDIGVASSVGVVALRPGATVGQLRGQLDTLPNGGIFGLERADWVPEEVRTAVRAQGQGLAVVALIVAIAALAVVGQLCSRQVRIPQAQRLALRAVGLTRRQVVGESVLSVALPVAVGTVVAGAVAYELSSLFPVGLAERVEPAPGLRFDPLVHLVGPLVLGALLVGWVAVSLLLGERETRTVEARGAMAQLAGRLPPLPISAGFRHALVRHPRDPGSVRAPIVGLVLVQAVLVGALVFAASVDRFLGEPARFGTNFTFATGVGGDTVPQEVRDFLTTDPDVSDVTLYGTLLATVGSTSLDVTGMEQLRGDLEPEVLSGRLPESALEMVLGGVAARELSLGLDDQLLVVGADPATFVVTGIAVIPGVEGGDGLGEGAVVTVDGLRRLDPEAALTTAAVRVRPGADLARLAPALGLVDEGPLDPPGAVMNIDRIRSTPFIVAASLAGLAALSMAQQLISSARRRRRDLAMVRALGAKRSWVSSAIHWQVTILALAVAVASVPIGVLLGRVVYREYIDRIGARTDALVPWAWIVLVVAGALVLGNLAAVVAAWRPRREQPAVTLENALRG